MRSDAVFPCTGSRRPGRSRFLWKSRTARGSRAYSTAVRRHLLDRAQNGGKSPVNIYSMTCLIVFDPVFRQPLADSRGRLIDGQDAFAWLHELLRDFRNPHVDIISCEDSVSVAGTTTVRNGKSN